MRRGQIGYVPHELIYVLLLHMHHLFQRGLIALYHVYWMANFKQDEYKDCKVELRGSHSLTATIRLRYGIKPKLSIPLLE